MVQFENTVLPERRREAPKSKGHPCSASTSLVAASALNFAPKDTICAVVATNSTGLANATISAKWMYQGGILVSNGEENIAANGIAATTFHMAKPDSFRAGKYTLKVSVAGKPANTAAFEGK